MNIFYLFQCHAGCKKSISEECNFGLLEKIYLPPHAVSVPRTEMPIESLIGVQMSRKDTMSRKYFILFV